MTIYDVMKQNIEILENVRIPAKETELWNAVRGVLQNEQACVSAMEEAEARKAEKEAENNVTPMAEAEAIPEEP